MFSLFSVPGLIALLLTLLGGLLLWLGRRQRQRSGLPEGTVLYRDTGEMAGDGATAAQPPLRTGGAPRLSGADARARQELHRPCGGQESQTARLQPYASHILQLATYCLLVRGKLRSCAPLRPTALRRRHATHRRTQTNCAAACSILPPISGRRDAPRMCSAATDEPPAAARPAAIAPPAGPEALN